MAPDNKWPSEDEDFDAVSDGKRGRTPVHVIDEDEENQQEEQDQQEKQEEHEQPQDSDSEPDSEATESQEEPEETPVETSDTDVEPETEPEPEPQEHFDKPAPIDIPKKSRNAKGFNGRLVLELVLIAGLVGLGLWNMTLRSDNTSLTTDTKSLKSQLAQLNANPQVAVQKQTQELITKVSALIDLPKDETPTVANVTDVNKAKAQSAFFNNAQNGDKVLMYVKAGQAVLYRPSTNKIILVAPLTFTNTTAANSSTKSTTTTPSTTRR